MEKLPHHERTGLIFHADLDVYQTCVLLVLNEYAGSNGRCFPPIAHVAFEAKISERKCQRVLGELVAQQLIVKQPQKTFAGRQTTNRYLIQWPKLRELRRQPPQPDRLPDDPAQLQLFPAPGGTDIPVGASRGAPQTPLNPNEGRTLDTPPPVEGCPIDTLGGAPWTPSGVSNRHPHYVNPLIATPPQQPGGRGVPQTPLKPTAAAITTPEQLLDRWSLLRTGSKRALPPSRSELELAGQILLRPLPADPATQHWLLTAAASEANRRKIDSFVGSRGCWEEAFAKLDRQLTRQRRDQLRQHARESERRAGEQKIAERRTEQAKIDAHRDAFHAAPKYYRDYCLDQFAFSAESRDNPLIVDMAIAFFADHPVLPQESLQMEEVPQNA